MAALPIREHFAGLKTRQSAHLLRGVSVGPLAFEGTDERLYGGMVRAIPFAAPAHWDPDLSQQELISTAGLLAAAIGMVPQARCWKPTHGGQVPVLLDSLSLRSCVERLQVPVRANWRVIKRIIQT